MILRNFDELIGLAKYHGKRSLAIACANDENVLLGIELAYNEGLIEPLLFGDKPKIEKLIKKLSLPNNWQIRHIDGDDKESAYSAVAAVKSGETDFLMKGQMQTSTLFSAVLDKKKGLEHRGIISHIAFVSIKDYPKLFGTTDGGLTRKPDFKQKIGIVKNTVRAFHELGYECPKIGLLSYVEHINKGDEETEDWGKIAEMAKNGDFGNALIEGPFGLDLCLSKEAKRIKGIKSLVAADVDAIVAPDITACNAPTKAMILRGGLAAGIVVGASVPIVALSRSDTPKIRLCSIATGIAMLNGDKKQ